MGTAVVHWELWSKDPARLSGFYEKVFGWKMQNFPEMDYRIAETRKEGEMGINGGITKPMDPAIAGNMTFYIAVDDLAAFRSKVVAAGGKIVVEEQAVPGMGSFALFSDPDGRVIGIWKNAL
jgi:predicted enzyme related to lactoylglutathione lyase